MAPKIAIYMLGQFVMTVNGVRIDQKIGKAKKGWLLIKYLILHRGRSVPASELIKAIWSEEEIGNPENALKTLVSRMRQLLDECENGLGRIIKTKRGSYLWNDEEGVYIDIAEVESLLKSLIGAEELTDETQPAFDRVAELYTGDLLPSDSGAIWTVAYGSRVHQQYIHTMYKYVSLLKRAQRHDNAIRVCRAVLELDPFDEQMHCDLMSTLIHLNRQNEAMIQYRHAVNMHSRFLDSEPPESLKRFYLQMINSGQMMDMDLDRIRDELTDHESKTGAYVCDYAIFKQIYCLQMRNFERLGMNVFLAIIMISSVDKRPLEGFKLDELMGTLLDVLKRSLRKGDTITQYSATQYALLLPSLSYATGRTVMERIKENFSSRYGTSEIAFDYRFGSIKESRGENK